MTASPIDLLREHGALNASVSARLAADAKITAAKAALLRGIGWGVFMLCLGGGVGLGFYGYASTLDMGPQAQRIADIVAKSVAGTELRTTGQVAVAAGSQVSLAPGGRVALEPGGTVAMDPASTVKAVGPASIPATAPASPAFAEQAGRSVPSAAGPVRTAILVEKVVTTDKGPVVTHWSYDQASDAAPRRQVCYRSVAATGGEAGDRLVVLGIDGKAQGQDDTASLANCLWYKPDQP